MQNKKKSSFFGKIQLYSYFEDKLMSRVTFGLYLAERGKLPPRETTKTTLPPVAVTGDQYSTADALGKHFLKKPYFSFFFK